MNWVDFGCGFVAAALLAIGIFFINFQIVDDQEETEVEAEDVSRWEDGNAE